MLYAFDTLLKNKVSAIVAAINSDEEAFRYECLCCGEEVYLAAKDSLDKSPHFRHRSGNNDKECELYLGQCGADISLNNRNIKHDSIDFYYSNKTQCFYVSLNFSEEEILEYESSTAAIEIRTDRKKTPFFEKDIDHCSFDAGIAEKFIIDKYASPYYISNSLNDKKREYYIFDFNFPSFFKIMGKDLDDEFEAKYIKSRSLYTDIKYFVAWPMRNTAQIKLRSIPNVLIEKEFSFRTFEGIEVWAMVVTFKAKSQDLENLLHQWHYNLEASESLLLLWPPSFENNEKHIISSPKAYVYSTFKIQEFGNVNTSNENISQLSNSVTEISINNQIHILKKNIEMQIEMQPLLCETNKKNVIKEYTDCFEVKDKNDFYLFSEYGVEKLKLGQKVFLTRNSCIAEYVSNSIVRIILFFEHNQSIEDKFVEILSNYWIVEDYQELNEDIKDLDTVSMPKCIVDYIGECKKNKCINSAVKKLLEEMKQ